LGLRLSLRFLSVSGQILFSHRFDEDEGLACLPINTVHHHEWWPFILYLIIAKGQGKDIRVGAGLEPQHHQPMQQGQEPITEFLVHLQLAFVVVRDEVVELLRSVVYYLEYYRLNQLGTE